MLQIDYFNFFMDNKSGWKTTKNKLAKKEPKIYEEIKNFSEFNSLIYLPFQHQIWHFINKYPYIPKCTECNKELTFKRSLKEGYGKYCSLSCTNKNKEHIENIKNKNIKKYGGTAPIASKEVKNKIKETNIKKYGVENTYQNVELVKNGFIKKHNVNHVSKVPGVLEKRKQTNIEKYGFLNNLNNPETITKTHETRRNYFLEKYKNFKFKNYIGRDLIIECDNCNSDYTIERTLFRHRTMYNINACTICNPISQQDSYVEKELYEFISSIYKDKIIQNDRKLITPKELDIYLPELKLAIEFDGIYWHSSECVDKNYHLFKTISCNNLGIDLIHIFENEWAYKKDIVKSIIKSKLNLYDQKIYARKTTIKEISTKDSKEFLNKNHIQGNVNAKIKFGLYYNDELTSVMSFGSLRKSLGSKSKFGSYEMLRFCNKLNTSVIGGAGKLFKQFIKSYKPNEIISYSDIRYFNGILYEKLKFNQDGNSIPNYWYVKDYLKLENRFKYRKDVLVREGYDSNKTEKQIMEERGFTRIYDCGNKKWVWKNQNFFY